MARRLFTILIASLLLVAAACGTTDDDKDTATDNPTTAEKEDKTSTTEEGDGDAATTGEGEGGEASAEFCTAVTDLESLFDDLEPDDYQGVIDAVDGAKPSFATYVDGLPDDLRDEGEMLIQALLDLRDELDEVKDDPDADAKAQEAFAKVETPELEAAGAATTEYEDLACPGN